MSWIAAIGTGASLLASQSGGGGGGGAAAPAAPSVLESGKVKFGDINLAPKSAISAPAWVLPVLAGLAVLGALFLFLFSRPRRR